MILKEEYLIVCKFCHSLEVKVCALSQVITDGTPKFLTQLSVKALQQVSALALAIGTASNHLLVLSTMVSRYCIPSLGVRGPTISICNSANRLLCTGRGSILGIMVRFGLETLQGTHWETKVAISDFICGQ